MAPNNVPFQVYFLYLNTDLSFRDQHLRSMLSLYFQIFSTYIESSANYHPEKVDS